MSPSINVQDDSPASIESNDVTLIGLNHARALEAASHDFRSDTITGTTRWLSANFSAHFRNVAGNGHNSNIRR